jgi:tetratricopeptide (TPR) repeat protein
MNDIVQIVDGHDQKPAPAITLVRPGHMRVHKAIEEANNIAALELAKHGHWDAAIILTRRMIAVVPGSVALWSNLATYLWNLQRYEEAEAALRRALEIDPQHTNSLCTLGLLCGSLKRFEEGEAALTQAIKADPDNKTARWDRSLLYLTMGDYRRGFAEYESRREYRAGNIYKHFPGPEWKGEDIYGKKIYVVSEQGIGDTIMFSRWLPWLAKKVGCPKGKVMFCTIPQVQSLMWDFRHIIEFVPEFIPLETLKADCFTYMGTIPARWGGTLADLPKLPRYYASRIEMAMKTSLLPMPEVESTKPEPFKIAMCWSGNPSMDRNAERSIPFDLLLNLGDHPAAWIYSVQVGPASQDIAKYGAQTIVCDLSPKLLQHGLAGLGTVLRRVDLVITCCTSVAHLAGSLGVPCWVLLAYDPYWIWMTEREDSPWYPSVRLFRQEASRDWAGVIDRVKSALATVIASRSA